MAYYMLILMGIHTIVKTPLNSHYPKINGIQRDYFNGDSWETLPRVNSVNGFNGLASINVYINLSIYFS